MNIHLDCPGCGRTLRVNQQFSGRTVRCPSCGTAYKAPAPRDVRPTPKRIEWEDFPAEELHAPCEGCGVLVRAPANGPARCAACRDAAAPETYRLADAGSSEAVFAPPAALSQPDRTREVEPPTADLRAEPPRTPSPAGPPCPECGEPMAADAVVCIACGFNRATGKRLRTVSQRLASRWDTGNFPLTARLVVCLVLVAASLLPALFLPNDPDALAESLLIPVAAAVIGGLLLGTFHRATVTSDAQGVPILIQNLWICFVPTAESIIDLTPFRTIRLTHRESSPGVGEILVALGLCLFGGLPAILFSVHLLHGSVYTLDILSRMDLNGEPIQEPATIYRGRSERMARGIGDALEQIGGLRYG